MNLLTMNNYAPMSGTIPGARLAFLHSVHAGEMVIDPKYAQEGLSVTRQWGIRRKPMQWSAAREYGYQFALLVLRGTFLVQGHNRRYLVPPRTLIHMPSESGLHALASRGEHDHLIITWREEETKGLVKWIEDRQQSTVAPRLIHCRPTTDAGFTLATLISQIENPGEATKPVVLGLLHALIGAAATQPYSMRISDTGCDFPLPLMNLIETVRTSPDRDWSLNGAAAEAGYSPFHLSRTFKALAGYGFPEFVDRCRTEIAVEKLLGDAEIHADDVAIQAGFGSTQAMRDAFRDYVGFLPSELRSSTASILE